MGKRCQLCGGKLRGNICVECGLDNSRNDEMYKYRSRECEQEALTHSHGAYDDPFAGKTMTKEQQREVKEAIRQRRKEQTKGAKSRQQYSSAVEKKSSRGGRKIRIGAVLIVLVIFGNVAGPLARETVEHFQEARRAKLPEPYEPEEQLPVDPYAYVTRELSQTGEAYEASLGAGIYKGGVHIPEGTYRLTRDSGNGAVELEDEENGISLNLRFGDAEEEDPEVLTETEDFRVYNGAILEIEDQVVLHFQTENAQSTASIPNPLTESVTVSDRFTVGKDVPAGVYDVTCLEGSGIFDYDIDRGNGYTSYEGKLIGYENTTFTEELKNIVLPEGTQVEILDMTVKLTPSAVIESEDYSSFYPAY